MALHAVPRLTTAAESRYHTAFRTLLTHPKKPSSGQFVKWAPIGRAQEAALELWGRDVWRVIDVYTDPNLNPSPTFVVVAPVDGGRLRQGFARTLLVSQIEGYD